MPIQRRLRRPAELVNRSQNRNVAGLSRNVCRRVFLSPDRHIYRGLSRTAETMQRLQNRDTAHVRRHMRRHELMGAGTGAQGISGGATNPAQHA
jgi:hypothetical protein